MQAHRSYHSYLIESLKDPAEAAAYLDAVLEDGELEAILLALKNVSEARQDLASTTDALNASWETCYQLLSRGEVPGIILVSSLLHDLGLKLSVTVRDEQAA